MRSRGSYELQVMSYGISDTLFEKVKEFEGCRLYAYRDSGGVLTIGYGHTRGVKAGQAITKKQAEEFLKADLQTFANYVNKLDVCQTQGQFDALVDFAFNLGIGSLQGSTLLKKIKAGAAVADIQAEFRRWVYCKGKKLAGLVKRREWEAQRYSS